MVLGLSRARVSERREGSSPTLEGGVDVGRMLEEEEQDETVKLKRAK